MKKYTVNIEKNNRERTTRMVEVEAENAQKAHKDVLYSLDIDEDITTIFSRSPNGEGRVVFKNSRGFFE